MSFHTIYSHAHPVSPHGDEVSLTDQQYLKDCDINTIMEKYRITGALPCTVHPEGVSGDFSDLGDFQICLDKINRGKAEFMSLPSALRNRFGNDPAAYVDFVLDPANQDECIKLGLREKPVADPKPVVDPKPDHVTLKGANVA